MKVEIMRNNGTIRLDNDKSIQFWRTNQKVAGIPIFKDRSKKIAHTLIEEEANIEKITKRHSTDVVCACHERIFKQVLEATQVQELDVEMFITEQRKIIHYAAIGIEPAVLLISCAY